MRRSNEEESSSESSVVSSTILQQHKDAHSQFPSGRIGLEGLQKIRELLAPNWDCRYEAGHWLKFRLWRQSEPSYSWLSHFAKKLEIMTRIPGARGVISRLDNVAEYQGAWAELDFALKLSLAGFDCRFIQTGTDPTPDLRATRGNLIIDVEVASMNPPPVDGLAWSAFQAVEWTAFTHKSEARGYFHRVPKPNEIDLIEEKVLKACGKAHEKNNLVLANVPGLMTCYVVPLGMLSEIPERSRSGFFMKKPRQLSPTERLVRVIDKKATSQLSKSRTALLSIYDQLILTGYGDDRQRAEPHDNHEIELALGVFPNLVGVVLVQPFMSVRELETKSILTEGRYSCEHSLPDFEAERCIVWRNPLDDDISTLEAVRGCLVDFPTRLVSCLG